MTPLGMIPSRPARAAAYIAPHGVSAPVKIARAGTEAGPRLGHVDERGWNAWIDEPSIEQVLTMSVGDRATLRTAPPRPLDTLSLLAPLRPPSVRDFVAFERHMEGMVMLENPDAVIPAAWYEAPGFYFSNPGSLCGTGAEVEIPPGCQAFDFELEIAAIIGAPGRDLTLADAAAHIGGYAILNDWSARDLQRFDRRMGMGWARARTRRRPLAHGSSPPTNLPGGRAATGG
jgi:2-keto-4-pentenoate hydratase/2-oxohepta-3-ene-1,7-dioic acid hydratase in catechol pathway